MGTTSGCLRSQNNEGLELSADHQLEAYFHRYRKGIIGSNLTIPTAFGWKQMVYAGSYRIPHPRIEFT